MPGAPTLVTAWVDHPRRCVCARGDWDLAEAERLAELLAAHTAKDRLLRVDLSGVGFLDCACLSVLLDAHERLLARGGSLVLTGITGRVERLIKLTGLNHVLYATRLSDLDDSADPLDPANGVLAAAAT
jgi:anti-sigma B factor antagonist